eukprot:GHVS01080466.1.p2 GENE.GHVS01080466.1~~GHVS01080466.1.p2  ORF type:complete len:243 (+),score=75.65 GHVS01080466.1:2116-2844(+)
MSTTPLQSSSFSSSFTTGGGSYFPFSSSTNFFSSSPSSSTASSSSTSSSYSFNGQTSQMNSFFSSLLSGNNPTAAAAATPTTTTTTTSATPTRPAFCLKRLQKERKELLSRPPENISMSEPKELFEWLVNIKGAEATQYADEEFVLKFRFPERYPLDSPEVTFVGAAPIHPHVYSNGHICLSILYDGWSPALSVASICLSLISMLSSCKRKARPDDDGAYVRMAGVHVSPKHMRWIFHDDSV